MKRRISKKAHDCSHHVNKSFMVTDDPYPMYQTEDYCKFGKYDITDPPYEDIDALHPCCNCNRFCASRPMIREKRERLTWKDYEKDFRKAYRCAYLHNKIKDFKDSYIL